MPSIKIRLDTATKLRNGAHPAVLHITWGNKVRRKRIKGFSAQKKSWDFDNHCFLHSDKKNGMLEEYKIKIRRIAQDVFPWNYREFLNRLQRDENKQQVQNKKLIAFCIEFSNDNSKPILYRTLKISKLLPPY